MYLYYNEVFSLITSHIESIYNFSVFCVPTWQIGLSIGHNVFIYLFNN